MDAAKQADVRRIVKFSGRGASLETPFRFNRMHAEIERYLEQSGLEWTHLRPSQFMQVYFGEAPTIASEGVFYVPLEDTRLAPVDVEDIAKAAASIPPAFADAMDELFRERRKGAESAVDLSTHETLGVRPTTFEEFARRNAAVFRGKTAPSHLWSSGWQSPEAASLAS